MSGRAGCKRGMAFVGGLLVCLGLMTPANALERLDFAVNGASAALEKELRFASILLAAQKAGRFDAQDLFADARAEYAGLLGALYASGHYSPVIHVLIDGREVAGIAPLDAPARIGRIEVQVDPGPVFAFSRAVVAPLAAGTVLPKGFAAGAVAESGAVVAAVGAAVDGWRDAGHAKAAAGAQNLVADHGAATLSAEVAILPGPRLRFGPLVVQGHARMREARVLEIAGLPVGQVYSPAEVERAAARLRRSGVFKSVALVEDDAITAPDLLGVTARLVEEKTRRYSFGAEIASFDGLMVNGTWLHRNLFGGAERLTLNGEIRNIGVQTGGIDYGLGVRLDRPATFTPDTTLGFGADYEHLDEADFVSDGFAMTLGLTHVFSDRLTARAGLGYAYSDVTDASGSAVFQSLSLPVGVTWDKRDSKTDATQGVFLEAEAKPFLGFGITDSGVRLTGDLRGYRAVGERVVFAGRVQAGAIFGASLAGSPRDDLFYSGGGGTVRGQPYQSLGVYVLQDALLNPFKTGGTYFVAGSVEARLKVSDTIGVVGFLDVGQVDADGLFTGAGNWHAGAGLGVRYATGVGPIRFDLALPVGGATGDGVQIYLGLGQAF
jgi:translocation and assembly module TamA